MQLNCFHKDKKKLTPGHDIVVIETSAGRLKALGAIIGALPFDLDAVLLVVQHLEPNKSSILPKILSDVGSLPASHPVDGEEIQSATKPKHCRR